MHPYIYIYHLQVLDQFERNADQRRFLLSIFVTLEQRVEQQPEDFAGLYATRDSNPKAAAPPHGSSLLSHACEPRLGQSAARVGGGGAERRGDDQLRQRRRYGSVRAGSTYYG